MFISILLPPLGVFPGIKHLRIHDQKTKLLGALYIVATTIATLAMLFIIYDSVHNLNKILNEVYQVKSYY